MSSTEILLGSYTELTHLVRFTAPTPDSPPSLSVVAQLAIPRASWIGRHPTLQDIFYIAHEADDDGGRINDVEGKIWVYRISRSGQHERLGEVSARENPCHVVVVGEGRGLAAANFAAGSAMLVPLNEDGTFVKGSRGNYVKFSGSGDTAAKCHQCLDVPSLKQCWIVDTGTACMRQMDLGVDAAGDITWTPGGQVEVLAGHGPRQAVVSEDGRHLYTLHARSCLLTHHDLGKPPGKQLVSTHDILPAAYSIDMNNRTPPFTFAAALNLHAPSSTLIATSRFLKGADVDSVAFLKLDDEGTVVTRTILRPRRGREYRGVGIVGDSYLVAGQHDGWMSCFEWDQASDGWKERDFEPAVKFDKIVDIESF